MSGLAHKNVVCWQKTSLRTYFSKISMRLTTKDPSLDWTLNRNFTNPCDQCARQDYPQIVGSLSGLTKCILIKCAYFICQTMFASFGSFFRGTVKQHSHT